MKYINRVKNDWAIDDEEYAWIVALVARLGIRTVLEFGPGRTTFALMENNCEVWSLEDSAEWLASHRKDFTEFPNVHLYNYKVQADLVIPELPERRYDLGIVDGPMGTYFNFHSRLCSAEYARVRTNRLLIHDARRPKERRTMEFLIDKGWIPIAEMVESKRGLIVFERMPDWIPPIITPKA